MPIMEQEINTIFPTHRILEKKNYYYEGISVAKMKIKGVEASYVLSSVEKERELRKQ